MKIYKIDASDLFLQEGNPNITNGIIYSSTKKAALKTARTIFKEAKQFSIETEKTNKLNTSEIQSSKVFAHEWATGLPGSVAVYLVTAKTLPARTLAEIMLNDGDWTEEEELVFTKSF